MSIKGGKIDASGEFIKSFRIVTDIDADAGLGTPTDPLRVDPTGTTVQPVSFNSAQHVIVDSGAGGTQYADGATQATPTGTVALGKDPSNVLKSLPLTTAGALKVDNSAVTQPISAVSLPLPTGAALDATLTGGTAQTKITDGTNVATVKAASTAAIATDKAVVVAVSPNNTIAATQSGTWTVQPGNTANTTAWKVDGSAVTQPVSGTVTDRLTGNAGAILDATVAPATAPANGIAVLAQANTAAPAPTNGQTLVLQADVAGNLRVNEYGNVGSVAAKSATGAGNTTVTLTVPSAKKWIVYGFLIKVAVANSGAPRAPGWNVDQSVSNTFIGGGQASALGPINVTSFYSCGPSVPLSAGFTNGVATVPAPLYVLGPGYHMNFTMVNGVAGDTITVNANVLELND
jgi:hypothetical protein